MVCMGKVAVELGVFVATVDSWVVGRGGSVGNVALGVVVCMGDGLEVGTAVVRVPPSVA